MRKWVGTSWKMNGTLAGAERYAEVLAGSASVSDPAIQAFVIPPLTVARQVKAALAEAPVLVGAQNMHWEDAGAWTGEVSAPMLTDCGLDMVELGHSERRMYFGETDETVALKAVTAVRHGLLPLICVGETRAERDAGLAGDQVRRQVRRALSRFGRDQKSQPIAFAYEPVWAIGEGGEAASPVYANERHAEIKSTARELLGRDVPCLYGGSVSLQNCAQFLTRPHIDGLFIGRAAWDAEGYVAILERCGARMQARRNRA